MHDAGTRCMRVAIVHIEASWNSYGAKDQGSDMDAEVYSHEGAGRLYETKILLDPEGVPKRSALGHRCRNPRWNPVSARDHPWMEKVKRGVFGSVNLLFCATQGTPFRSGLACQIIRSQHVLKIFLAV